MSVMWGVLTPRRYGTLDGGLTDQVQQMRH